MTVCMDSPSKVRSGQAGGHSSWVLFVDDEPLLVDSYQRALCDQFRIRTATSAQQALALMEEHGAPAVVVADQQMPGMSGIEFLVRCQQVAPEAVRVMLTGRADLPVAIQAVNQSEVFRFLTKPVGSTHLREVVAKAQELHLQQAEERRRLAQVLAGDVGHGPAAEPSALGALLEARLTPRELEVLRLIGEGASSKEIASRLGISHRTVDVHRSHVLGKLKLHNSVSLVKVALMAGLI